MHVDVKAQLARDFGSDVMLICKAETCQMGAAQTVSLVY
jgi:hypothetical protein